MSNTKTYRNLTYRRNNYNNCFVKLGEYIQLLANVLRFTLFCQQGTRIYVTLGMDG